MTAGGLVGRGKSGEGKSVVGVTLGPALYQAQLRKSTKQQQGVVRQQRPTQNHGSGPGTLSIYQRKLSTEYQGAVGHRLAAHAWHLQPVHRALDNRGDIHVEVVSTGCLQ